MLHFLSNTCVLPQSAREGRKEIIKNDKEEGRRQSVHSPRLGASDRTVCSMWERGAVQ